jgi:DNA-binding GntR family transcriptional regulator
VTTAEFSNLAAPIVQTLKQRIIGWEYPPHHRFTEASLCAEFGVSRSPVREALRILATHGFVLKMANRGYAVRQVNPREVTELYELRLALELYVVEHLARQETPDSGLAPLRRSWEAVQQGPERPPEELAELDTRFHETLAELAGNQTLLEHLRAINERLFVFRTIDFQKSDRAETSSTPRSRTRSPGPMPWPRSAAGCFYRASCRMRLKPSPSLGGTRYRVTGSKLASGTWPQ